MCRRHPDVVRPLHRPRSLATRPRSLTHALAVLLLAVSVLVFSGCGDDDENGGSMDMLSDAGTDTASDIAAGCLCAVGETCCATATAPMCVDLDESTAHCGACNNACPTGAVCRSGRCATTSTCDCGAGETCCPDGLGGEVCVDTQSAPGHCGSCGNVCPTGVVCSGGTCGGGTGGDPYFFVRIDDLSAPADTADGGADIDAIILDKADGTQAFADSVEGYVHGGGTVTGDEIDPTAVTGLPDAFYAYPDTTVCDVSSGRFVSLGGTGGLVIAGMNSAVQEGDVLNVLEVGGCDFGAGTAISEPVDVSVSTAKEIDGTWTFLGSGTGPEITINVPPLP